MIKTNKTGKLLLCMVISAMCMFSACDDTVDGSTTLSPEFPSDTLSLVAIPGDTVEVSFNAAVNWKLSSNKDWCRTLDGAMDTSDVGGKQIVVPFVISDKGYGFTEDKANITLWMNGEGRVIACVTRRAKGYFLELSGDSCMYAAGESIVLGTSGRMPLSVNTNIEPDQLRMEFPAWLKPTRDEETIVLEVLKDSLRYSINHPTDSLILFNSDTTFSCSYHVQYKGMDSREIRISPQMEEVLIVSRDAKRCYMGGVAYTMPIGFRLETLNDLYKLVYVGYDEDGGCAVLPNKERWFVVEDDRRGNIGLLFEEENLDDERMAYLLALPQAVVDSLTVSAEDYDMALGNFLWGTDSIGDLKEEVRKYCLVKIAQDGVMDITISPETRWNLRVSTDGKTYCDAIRGDTLVAADHPVEATITTYRGYKLMCASYDGKVGCSIMEVEDSWLNIVDDQQGDVRVRFKVNGGNERILYLFALPLPLVESLEVGTSMFHANLSAELFEEVDGLLEIKADAEQFVIAKFTQEADEGNSVKVIRQGRESIEVVKETDQQWLDIAATKGVAPNRVFSCKMNLDYKYQINPLIPMDVWNTAFPENKDRIEVYGKSGKLYESGVDYDEEHTLMEETEGNYMLVQLIVTDNKVDGEWVYNIQEDFIIYFINNDTDYLKALVVTRL